MSRKLFALIAIIHLSVVAVFTSTTCAQSQPPKALRGSQWDVMEIRYHAKESSENPFTIDFSAEFTHESGKRVEALGFYDGDKTYVLRFTPSLAGTWRFTTKSSLGSLNRVEETLIEVEPARVNRNGGIVVDPKHRRRFQYENGTRYYPIAFECDWLFALDAENPTEIPKTRKFVDTLATNGFNQVVMNVFAYDVKWKKDERLQPKHEFGSPRVFPFGGSNESPRHAELNLEYFRRLDRVIRYLDEKGLVAHLMIYVWNKRVNWPEANSPEDNRYFDYVAKRYQAFPNLVWDISKEALGYGHTDVHYITDRIERLRKLDAYNRLITVHDYSYCRRFAEQVDFVSVQLWLSELHSVMRNVIQQIPDKPILNIEHGGYERSPYVVFTGNYTSPEVCLERAYQCVFAGTYPTHYWQGAAWNVIIPDVESLPVADRPRFEYYRHMRAFVDKYKLDELTAGDKKSNAGFSLHNGKELYIYYVPKECDYIGLRLPKTLRGGLMTGTWFDPFSGKISDPVTKEIPQWPAYEVPKQAHESSSHQFRILIVRAKPKAE